MTNEGCRLAAKNNDDVIPRTDFYPSHSLHFGWLVGIMHAIRMNFGKRVSSSKVYPEHKVKYVFHGRILSKIRVITKTTIIRRTEVPLSLRRNQVWPGQTRYIWVNTFSVSVKDAFAFLPLVWVECRESLCGWAKLLAYWILVVKIRERQKIQCPKTAPLRICTSHKPHTYRYAK